MEIIRRLIRLLVFVVLLGGSFVVFGVAFSIGRWQGLETLVQTGQPVEFWIGVALFCIAFLFAGTNITRREKERYLTFDTDGGTISISTSAISDYLAKLAGEFPSIVRMRPRVVPCKNAIDVRIDLRVKAGPDIHEVCELLQQRARETVINGLGISDIRRIQVTVREILSEHRPL